MYWKSSRVLPLLFGAWRAPEHTSMARSLQFMSHKLARVIAGVGHPSRFPRIVPCHLDVLGRIESPGDGFFVLDLEMS